MGPRASAVENMFGIRPTRSTGFTALAPERKSSRRPTLRSTARDAAMDAGKARLRNGPAGSVPNLVAPLNCPLAVLRPVCTFVFAWQVFEGVALVVAANRDERLGRESLPPKELDTEPRVIAPQDAEAEGTWIGYNGSGVLVSVTNRWTDRELAGERSRGLLVREALAHETAEEAISFVEAQTGEYEYDGFHLVAVDAERAALCAWDGELSITDFEPGVHITVNVGADDSFEIPRSRPDPGREQARRTERAFADLQPESDEGVEGWLDRTTVALRDHEYGFCVHGDGFGTRSSSLVTLFEDGSAEYRFANGPPCETAYEPVELDDDTLA